MPEVFVYNESADQVWTKKLSTSVGVGELLRDMQDDDVLGGKLLQLKDGNTVVEDKMEVAKLKQDSVFTIDSSTNSGVSYQASGFTLKVTTPTLPSQSSN